MHNTERCSTFLIAGMNCDGTFVPDVSSENSETNICLKNQLFFFVVVENLPTVANLSGERG